MPNDVIDTLSLEITSNAQSADKALNGLVKSLQNLQGAVDGVSSINFGNFTSAMASLKKAFSGFGGSDNLSKGISQIQRLGRMDSEGIRTVSTNITQLSTALRTLNGITIPNMDGLDSLVRSLGKLGGIKVSGATGNLPTIARELTSLMQNLNSIGAVNFDVAGLNGIVNTVARLGYKSSGDAARNMPELSRNLKEFVKSLEGIGAVNFDPSGLSTLISSITKLGGKAATNAIPNIERLGTALLELMRTLSGAPQINQSVIQMTQAMAQLASGGNRVTTATNGVISTLSQYGTAASGAAKKTISLTSVIGKLYAKYFLVMRAFRLLKKSIDISSDLTEVQNVADVTFGDFSNKVEDLSQHSIKDFGMSELTAKGISSRFQAMGSAMGFAQDKMADMSIRLTELTADMASFYNVEQKDVAEDLESIFTGQTRPLRTYGLDLTEATLKEWALKNGLDANIKSMSQMEKTMLRYQYVLSNMTIVNGDFQRTVGTWANQTRILGQNFESLGSVIGGTLINVFKPFVAGLNVVMENVIAFSKTVANALGAIFGWTIEMEAGGLANDFYDAADAADALADGTGDAADNAKKTQKTLSVLPFDELNQLTKESDKTGKNGGSGSNDAASGDALANAANLIKTDSLIEKYKSEIDNLYKLGKYIGDTLTDAMNGINWESAYESARNFGTGLADFLNGLISPELFGALGRTIAGSLNTAINAALYFGETFDWKDLGLSIAEGVNEFFDKFSFSDLAKAINAWAHGIFDMLLAAMRNIKWAEIGTEIGNFLSDVDFIGIAKKMAQLFWERVNAAFALYSNMFTAAPIETALLTVFAAPRLMKHLSPGIQSFCKSAGKIFSSSFSAATSAFNTTMATAGSTVFASLTAAGQGFIGKFKSGLKELDPVMKGVFSAATALGEFKLIEDGIQRLDDGVGGFIAGIGEIGGAVAIAGGIFTSMFGVPAGVIATAIVGLVGVFSGLKKAIEESFNESPTGQFVNAIDALAQDVADKSESIREDIQNTVNSVSDAADAETARARDLASEYENLASKSNLTTGEKQRLKDISNDLVDIIPELQEYIDDETGALEIQSDTLSTIIDKYDSLARANAAQEALTDAYKEQYSAQMNLNDAVSKYQEYAEDFIASQGNMNDSIKNLILDGDIQGLYDYRDAVRETAGSYDEMRDKFMGMSVTGFTEWIMSLEDSTKDYREALDDANETLDESGEAVDYLRGVLEEQEEASRKASDALREQWKASSEGKQTLSDLTTDLENLGLSLKESFVEDLAFEDFDSSSLKRFFKSIQDGVAQSSADIKGAFEEVGLSIPDDLADAIESKSPEVQGRVIKLLMNIKSGVQGNSEDIKKVFGSLGMELPDALIDNLASKESSVQSKTIELLSKMEVGHSLSEENLTSMFANIGLRVPGALIESLSSQKAEVQYQALDLLGQIGTASGAKKQELIDDLNQFGVDVTQAGLVTAISGQQESVSGVTLQMLSEGMGGAFAKMNPVLSQTAKDTGEKVSTSIADGVSSKTSDATSAVTDVTSEMAKTANSNLGISGSESKVFKDAGETSGQSLATGFKSQSGIIGQNVFDMVSGATGKLQGMDQTFSDSGVKSSNALGKAFSGNKMAVISIVSDLKKGLISTFDGMSTKFNELGRQMSTSLSNGISEGSGAAVNVLSGLMRNLSGMGGQMYNVGRDVAQQFAYGFSSVHIPTPHWDIRYQYMTVGNQKVAIPNINVNWYKTGGLFGSPAVIGIGEAGEEAVLPLENRKAMKRIADAILENSSGINEEKLAQTISSSVALAMNMSSMNQRGTEYMQNNIYLDGRVMARAVTKAQEKKDYISNPSGKL